MQHIKPQEPVVVVLVHDNKEERFFLELHVSNWNQGKAKSTIKIESSESY